MSDVSPNDVLGRGRFLQLVRRNGWEFVQRTRPVRSVFIGALTDDGCLLLTKEFRIPVGKICVGFPAGLVGDVAGQEAESVETAAKRELLEEAGFEAESVTFLTEGPTSPGQTDEVIAIVLAAGLKKVGPGGGVEGEQIQIHEVPLAEAHAWLQARAEEGCLIDPKVYTGLYFIHHRRKEIDRTHLTASGMASAAESSRGPGPGAGPGAVPIR
jgi:ADP-ribose pyrophosphatase